jgi:hypothetical protein
MSFFSGISSPLLVHFDCRFRADFEAVAASNTFSIVSNFSWMITTGIDPIRQNEDIHRTDVIATKTTALANFLQNLNLRH